jgi:5-hydroxyisourate hydrolase-like protein (transthyretin family)
VISSVPEGTYYVIAEQDGYVSPLSLFTREQLNKPDEAMLRKISRYMTAILVTPGHTTQTEIRLVRGATIAGKVNFEDGSPAVEVAMALMQKDDNSKWKEVRVGRLASHGRDQTDDQGVYRFTGLPAGEYVVRATIELNNVILDHIFAAHGATSYGDGYHLQVFPEDKFRVRDAKPVKVEEGEVAAGVNVDVPLSRLHSLAGVVLRPGSAAPVNAARVTLAFTDNGDELTSTEVSSDDGTFRFDFVPEGDYTLRLSRAADVQRSEVVTCKGCIPPTHTQTKTLVSYGDASLPMKLSGDQSGVVVQAKPAAAKAASGMGQ